MASRQLTPLRDLAAGDLNDLQLQVRDLSAQLTRRKESNVILKTENERLKKQLYDLSQRIASIESGKPTKRGEASTIGALRLQAAATKQDNASLRQGYEQLIEESKALSEELALTQHQLGESQTRWQAAAAQATQLKQAIDNMQSEYDKAIADKQRLLTELQSTSEALAQERQLRSDAEGQAGQREHSMLETQTRMKELQAGKQQELASLQQLLDAAKQEAAATAAALVEQKKLTKAQEDRATGIQAQVDVLQKQMSELQQLASAPVPDTLTTTTSSLTNQQTNTTNTTNTATVPAAAPKSSSNSNSSLNHLELILHEASISPESAGFKKVNFWGMVCCEGGGMAAARPVLVCVEPGSEPLPINVRHVMEFDGSSQEGVLRAVEVLSTQSLSVSLYNLKTSLLGGLKCPAPQGHPSAGQPVPMLACASQYRPVVTCVTLYTLKDDSAVLAPAAAAHTLSVDWQGVLPQGTPAPRTDEFVIPIQRLDAMVLESVRMSGLFSAGRTFPGTDGQTYQVWAAQDDKARRKATQRYLDQDLEVAPDLASAAQPIANAKVPLSAAFSTPSAAATHREVMKDTLQRNNRPGLYAGCPENGTSDLTLRTPYDAPVATCRTTLRLGKDMQVAHTLLSAPSNSNLPHTRTGAAAAAGALAVAGTAAAAAAAAGTEDVAGCAVPLPAAHWAAAMAAEAVGLWRTVGYTREQVVGAVATLGGRPAWEPKEQDACQQAVLQATDAVQVLVRQVPLVQAACSSVCVRAQAVSPSDGALAHTWQTDLNRLARRVLFECLVAVRQCRTTCTDASPSASSPANPTPATGPTTPHTAPAPILPLPTAQQLHMLQTLEDSLLQACQQLQWLPTQRDAAAEPHTLAAAAIAIDAAAAAAPGGNPAPAAGAPQAAITASMGNIQGVVSECVPSVSRAVDQCRKQLAAPPSPDQPWDPTETVISCQQRVANVLGAVTRAVVQGCEGVCRAGKGWVVPAGMAGGAGLAAAATASSAAGAAAAAAALAASQVQLQVVLTQLSKCEPWRLPPAGVQAAEVWLRAAWRLSTQLCAARGLWASVWARHTAHTLLATGQRTQAVQVLLDALSADAVRVVQSTVTRVTDLKSQRVYNTDTVQACRDALLLDLTQHVTAATVSVFDHATQTLVAPTATRAVGWVCPQQSAPTDPAVTSRVCVIEQGSVIAANRTADTFTTGSAPSNGSANGSSEHVLPWKPKGKVLLVASSAYGTIAPAVMGADGTPGTASNGTQGSVFSSGLATGSTPPLGPTVEELCVRNAADALGWEVLTLDMLRAQAEAGAAGAPVAEAQVLAQASGQVDLALVLLPRGESGSVVSRLTAMSVVVLEPQQDTALQRAMAGAVAEHLAAPAAPQQAATTTTSTTNAPLTGPYTARPGAEELARQIIARLARAKYSNSNLNPGATTATEATQATALGVGTDTVGVVAGTTSGSQSMQSNGSNSSSTVWVHHTPHKSYYEQVSESGSSEALLAAARSAHDKLRQAIDALSSALQGSAMFAEPGARTVYLLTRRLAQGKLVFEGLIAASAVPVQGAGDSVAQGAVSRSRSALVPTRSMTSSQDGSGRRTPGLPPLTRRPSATQAPAPAALAAAAAALVSQPVAGSAVRGGMSTESEDAEQYVMPLSAVVGQLPGGTKGSTQVGQGVEDQESDGASIVSSNVGAPYTRPLR